MSWALPEYIEPNNSNTYTPFKYNVGETVNTPSSDVYIRKQVRMFDGIKKSTGSRASKKAYIYQCEKCHYIGLRAEKNFEKYGCPVCSGSMCKWNINSTAIMYPKMIELFYKMEDAYDYGYNSHKKVDFVCPNCKSLLKNKMINNVVNNGLQCPFCSDGVSIGERIMRSFLKESNIEFEMHKSFPWSDRRNYDFYLPKYNMVIEMQGMQHSGMKKADFSSVGGRTSNEERMNDKYKLNLAEENGYTCVWIDCQKSDFEYIKWTIRSNIELAINKINTETVDWKKIELDSQKSLLLEAVKMWNNYYTSSEIKQLLGYCSSTINNWLTTGTKLGLCNNYNSAEANRRKGKKIIDTKTGYCFWSIMDYIKIYYHGDINAYSLISRDNDIRLFDDYIKENNDFDPHEFFVQHLYKEK